MNIKIKMVYENFMDEQNLEGSLQPCILSHSYCYCCWCCLFVNCAATSGSDATHRDAGVDDFVDVLVEFDGRKGERETHPTVAGKFDAVSQLLEI